MDVIMFTQGSDEKCGTSPQDCINFSFAHKNIGIIDLSIVFFKGT